MKLEYFIAHRFSSAQSSRNMSRPAVRIAIIGIALGLAVMLISIAVIMGFKTEVSRQIVGFGSHIQVLPPLASSNADPQSIAVTAGMEQRLAAVPNVASVQHIISRTGIIHTPKAFQGVILKGVDSTYQWTFFRNNTVKGVTLDEDTASNAAMISQTVANAMQLDTGDRFNVYFVDNTLRARRLRVAGIYRTTFADYDKLYIITQLNTMQQLNGWAEGEYSSLELLVSDFGNCEQTAAEVYSALVAPAENRLPYRVESIRTLTPQIFDWLDMLDMNAIVILVLMIAVSGFCVISGLLILILERAATIGLFKSIGATDNTIRRIFLAQGFILISRGMLWGNLIGTGLIAIQYFTHILPLDAASYYVDHVPVCLSPWAWLAVNLTLAVAAMLMLVAPSHLVARISPAEAMRRE